MSFYSGVWYFDKVGQNLYQIYSFKNHFVGREMSNIKTSLLIWYNSTILTVYASISNIAQLFLTCTFFFASFSIRWISTRFAAIRPKVARCTVFLLNKLKISNQILNNLIYILYFNFFYILHVYRCIRNIWNKLK